MVASVSVDRRHIIDKRRVWRHGQRRRWRQVGICARQAHCIICHFGLIQNTARRWIVLHDAKHFDRLFAWHLLSISRIGHRFALVVLECYFAKTRVWYVLNHEPFYIERAFPLGMCPLALCFFRVVQLREQLGYSAKVAGRIHREQQIYTAERFDVGLILAIVLVEGFVQNGVAMIS